MKYSMLDFITDFPTEEACFDMLVSKRSYPCPCGKEYKYRIKGRRTLSCACGKQISPLKTTIVGKSRTPLRKWVMALYLIAQARNGISAVELQNQLNISYKTAWAMAHKVRSLMKEENLVNYAGNKKTDKLQGVVEADEAYFGRRTKRGKETKGKGTSMAAIFGMVERGGRARAVIIQRVNALTLFELIGHNIKLGSTIVTDQLAAYRWNGFYGLKHYSINHSQRIYGRMDKGFNVTTNAVEGLWSHIKRHIRGTHVAVSKQHLQKYLDQAIFHYNRRGASEHAFSVLLRRASLSVRG